MEVSMHQSKSRKHADCSCTGRTPGNPKYGHGPCYGIGGVRPAVRERKEGRRLVKDWLLAVRRKDEVDA